MGISNETPKMWYESKTVWFNIIMTLILVASFVTTVSGLPEWVVPVSMIVQGVGNIVLRVWFTDSTVERKLL